MYTYVMWASIWILALLSWLSLRNLQPCWLKGARDWTHPDQFFMWVAFGQTDLRGNKPIPCFGDKINQIHYMELGQSPMSELRGLCISTANNIQGVLIWQAEHVSRNLLVADVIQSEVNGKADGPCSLQLDHRKAIGDGSYIQPLGKKNSKT